MNLKTYLKNKNLNDSEFAVLINTSQTAVNRYKLGRRTPSPDVMQRIIDVTGGEVTANDWYDLPIAPAPESSHAATNST
jgi:transcriptional regulator with XRE-family HTH domain